MISAPRNAFKRRLLAGDSLFGLWVVQAVLEATAQRIVATGRCPGILAIGSETARRYAGWGYRFVGAATDIATFAGAARGLLAACRGG